MQELLTVKVDSRMKTALKELADKQFISVSAAVKQAVEKHLQEQGIDWRQHDEPGAWIRAEPVTRPATRSSPGLAHRYYAVEIPSRDGLIHQFNIQETARNGVVTILAKEGSQVLEDLKAGGKLLLKLYSADPVHPVEHRTAEIIHIGRNEEGRFRGHYAVGLRLTDAEEG